MNLSCSYYCKGIASPKVRDQVIAHLVNSVDEMAALAESAKPTKPLLTAEQIAAQRDLDQCLELQARGIAIDQKSISELRAKLAVAVDLPGPDWSHWRQLIRQNRILEGMPDDELRAVVSELIEELRYVGNPVEVEITLRS